MAKPQRCNYVDEVDGIHVLCSREAVGEWQDADSLGRHLVVPICYVHLFAATRDQQKRRELAL